MTRTEGQIKTTKTTDNFGNVLYVVERDGERIGQVHKLCGGRYKAVFPSGSYVPNLTLRKAVEMLNRAAS